MSRDVPYDPKAKCDSCGKLGAMDFMGDVLCGDCAYGSDPEMGAPEPQLKVKKLVGIIPHDCEGGAGCSFPDLEHVKRSENTQEAQHE